MSFFRSLRRGLRGYFRPSCALFARQDIPFGPLCPAVSASIFRVVCQHMGQAGTEEAEIETKNQNARFGLEKHKESNR